MFGTILRDPCTWGAIGVSIAVALLVGERFPLDGMEHIALSGFAAAQFLIWLAIAGASGRYHSRWNERELAQARGQSEDLSRRVDSLKLAFTRLDLEAGTTGLEALVRSYSAFRRAIGARPPASQQIQRRISEAAGQCYNRGLAELEALSSLMWTLEDTVGAAEDTATSERFLRNADQVAEGLISVAISFSDGSRDDMADIETRLNEISSSIDISGTVSANDKLERNS
ncbi:MAG: hypothetical protein AAF501_10855 [Pseudomonadota bacterium]